MNLQPNEVQRRGRSAGIIAAATMAILVAAFFRTQVLDHSRYALQSDDNRLNEVPLPAPRGRILDRNGEIIAEDIPGYTVSMLATDTASLRAMLQELSAYVSMSDSQVATITEPTDPQGADPITPLDPGRGGSRRVPPG